MCIVYVPLLNFVYLIYVQASNQIPRNQVQDNRTTMEKEILTKVLNKHRDGIIVKQVAAGREFTGQPFMTSPSVIHFAVSVI